MKESKRSAFTFLCVCAALFLVEAESPRHGRGNRENGSTRSGALEALEFWTRARAFPNADIPPDGYYRAYTFMKTSMKSAGTISSSDSVWRFIGPTNFSGRIISIAVNPLDPNTLVYGPHSRLRSA